MDKWNVRYIGPSPKFKGLKGVVKHASPLQVTVEWGNGRISVHNWLEVVTEGGAEITSSQARVSDPVNQPQDGVKYLREIKPGVFVDVYDVLRAFAVVNPALQHLIKKALAVGQRGHKDAAEDLQNIYESAKRAIELERDNA
ncbi:hypothetical protein [Enterobacter phage SDFMU_EhYP]|uniref:Uncharacterized protein n=1 Tax=Enterobacter phage SDFMU_EhYP TaxID=3076128 RepID=A0AA96KRE2_9CAUD|nr:hypothetical protein [Enterobacter phage SDFMU_EhYP]